MRFSELAKYLERLENTSSRNAMTVILADALKRASAEEMDKLCYLLLGELVPSYRGLEFQIAEKMMIQVLASAYRGSLSEAQRMYKQKGDLGDVAYELAGRRRPEEQGLTVSEVHEWLRQVAVEVGEGSQGRKVERMAGLLRAADRLSAKFIARIPVGRMRLGFSEATLLDALSLMVKSDKSARPAIERAFNVTADIGAIAARLKRGGLGALSRIAACPGIPIRSSLAERLNKIEEVIKKAGPEVGVEPKLDGFRTQIHIWREGGKKRVALFSRNLENTTSMFPEIAAAAMALPVKSAILDGETIGYNQKTGKFLPFQETVQRKRKHGVAEFAKKIPLAIFVFDLLYLDGKSLLAQPLRERRAMLEELFTRPVRSQTSKVSADAQAHRTSNGARPLRVWRTIRLVRASVTRDPTAVASALVQSVGDGLEGLVVKNLDLPYEAGSRGFHWIKFKATTAALEKLRAGPVGWRGGGVPDTIDCVVMGGYRGRGKRTQFGVGGLLLGVRGGDERYYSISRLGTGLSDEQLREASRRIRALRSREQPKEYVVEKETSPDFWANPGLIAEILADEITLSPRHTAGRKKEGRAPPEARPARGPLGIRNGAAVQTSRRDLPLTGRGYSLRFPRLVRFRDDKNPEDATTVGEVVKMYRRQ